MKNNSPKKKLTLSQETIRRLDNKGLRSVAGGGRAYTVQGADMTCRGK